MAFEYSMEEAKVRVALKRKMRLRGFIQDFKDVSTIELKQMERRTREFSKSLSKQVKKKK